MKSPFRFVSFLLFLLYAFILSCTSYQVLCENDRPIIGVLTLPPKDPDNYSGEIVASYVKWLESAGAQAAVLPYSLDANEFKLLLSSLNGVLLTGGADFIELDPDSDYIKAVRMILDKAKEFQGFSQSEREAIRDGNPGSVVERADFFPVWGTCLGFEAIICVENMSKEDTLSQSTDYKNVSLPVEITSEADNSLLFENNQDIISSLSDASNPIPFHNHQWIIPIETFVNSYRLSGSYSILGYTEFCGDNCTPSVTIVEHFLYPIFATAFHPEKNAFEWALSYNINHSSIAVGVMQTLSQTFVDYAKMNSNMFLSEDEQDSHLIYNYSPTYTGKDSQSTTTQVYYLPI
ncbi:putative multi-domain containing protein [Aduncisulcus paluster]|uniref:folate gamma-glutamyl hydrolase n=1 Tax=Aduncisulcus paluster TaxID=2918883 RepID=A0ABQ5KXK9_9EUKA|nr:putative multi-domain containing protein [Aduncisulcus paluster]|eukprot:gnl/Carplike_NY0171/2325_a3132_419.p1 GENE.gnl/Carplike_NY0171/2325_a3132_419~~gnl/Carplike_NY0171/2325_a3132_419.p1  ORF type:complete len:348 (-),score=40.93 gnl/Carplike_NY0171/2325_a3132_419:62-1105(-)